MEKIKVKIDGKEVIADKGKTVLQIAREAGIYIPTLCFHPALEPYGGCRLCIVEIQGMKGYPTSCSTPAQDGMEIKTNTETLNLLRRETLKFILTEHPNACLICPERERCKSYQKCIRKAGITTGCRFCPNDGQCEFQELVEKMRIEEFELNFHFRNFPLEDEDPFFDRDYNLCILCERCVRVCNDVRGAGVLTVYFRGSQARVGTAFGKSHIDAGCQFCGACVDVCPTGALYEKQSRWLGVPERVEESICVLCGIGCKMNFKVKDGKFASAFPSENGFNKGQACLKGRFLIPYIVNNRKRISDAFIKIHGMFEKVKIEEALDFVAKNLSEKKDGDFALILSPYLSNEDLYIGQKFARKVMKSNSVDTISSLFFNPSSLTKGIKANKIDKRKDYGFYLILGDSPLETSQVLRVFFRKKIKEGKKVAIVSAFDPHLSSGSEIFLRIKPGEEGKFLADILEGSKNYGREGKKIEELLKSTTPSLILYGSEIFQNENSFANLLALRKYGVDIFPASLEGNTYGAFLMGCNPEIYPGLLNLNEGREKFSKIWNSELPSYKGNGINEIVENHKKTGILYLCGEFPYIPQIKADFIIYQGIVHSPLSEIADVVIPSTTFIETEGTYINFNGVIQKGKKIVEPKGYAMPDWWIFCEIAKRMNEDGFDFRDSSEIFDELKKVGIFSNIDYSKIESEDFEVEFPSTEKFELEEKRVISKDNYPLKLVLRPFKWTYRDFFMLEQIKDLRRIIKPEEISINPGDARKFGIKNGDEISLKGKNENFRGVARIDENVPEEHLFVLPQLSWFFTEGETIPVSQIINVKIERG
ncbi:MAG: molybdopterin-dependent oxidoreductase [Candidatus Aminicenantia bacterium]